MKVRFLVVVFLYCLKLQAVNHVLVSTNPSGETNTVIPGTTQLFDTSKIFSSLSTAQSYILGAYSGGQVTEDITVHIRGGFYPQGYLNWKVTSNVYNVKIIRYEKEKVIFDGKKSNGALHSRFLYVEPSFKRSNLWIEGLIIQNYLNGIAFGKTKRNTDGTTYRGIQSSHNTIKNNVFRNIGNKFSTESVEAYSALGLCNSSHNTIVSNIFYRNENVAHRSLIHSIYIAHHSSDNDIINNYASLCSGGAFRIRDGSNNNDFINNYIDQSGNNGFISDWYRIPSEYSATPEEKSINTLIKGNTCTFAYPEDAGAISLFHSNGSSSFINGGNNFVIVGKPYKEEIGGTASGDIDGDGIEEHFTAFNYTSFTKIVRTRPGMEPYLSQVIYTSKNWKVGDLEMNYFNKNGSPVLITAFNELTNNVDNTQIFKGDGVNSATNYGKIFSHNWWKTAALTSGDYDGNGTIELYTAFNAPDNSGADNTQVFKGNGINSVINWGKKYNHRWWKTKALTSGDYNGDGKDEVFVAFNTPDGTGSNKTQVFKGDGVNSVTNLNSFYSHSWWRTGAITSGDFDADGKDEVVLALNAPDYSGAYNTQVHKGDGVNSLMNLGNLYQHSWWGTGALQAGNFNNDRGDEIAMFYLGATATQMFYGNGTPQLNTYGQYYRSEKTNIAWVFKKEQTTGIASLTGKNEIVVYPNPSKVGRAINVSGINSGSIISIYSVKGQLVESAVYKGESIHIAGLSKGIYMIRIFDKEKIVTRKLIIQ